MGISCKDSVEPEGAVRGCAVGGGGLSSAPRSGPGPAVWLELAGSRRKWWGLEAGAVRRRSLRRGGGAKRIDQPKPRPGLASPAPGPWAPPPGCGSGRGSALRGRALRGGSRAARSPGGDMDPSRAIQQEISSLKGAGRGRGPSQRARTRQ